MITTNWDSFDSSGVSLEGVPPCMIKRVLYVTTLCENHQWGPLDTVIRKEIVSLSWPNRRITIHTNGETDLETLYDGVSRPVEMVNMESTLLWHLSREMNLATMKSQFCRLFEDV